MLEPLPIGLQTFAKVRDGGFVYVDKTPHAYQLAKDGGFYFLSRPRRFGKSLFLDTLHQLFACRRELFEGLFIADRWDWQTPYPVIRISFGGGVMADRADLRQYIAESLRRNSEDLGVDCGRSFDDRACFAELIRRTHVQYGQPVVVLVDEYDKPILDRIEQPAIAAEIREELKDFYSVIKDSEQHLHFCLLTGVSKFSKVSLFSGLNNLQDVTLDPAFATVCGYTQGDVETQFGEHLAGVDMDELRRWYNGYRWLGEPVYNPFDILLFIAKGRMYRSYWFETGSPSFLIKLFRHRRYFLPDLQRVSANEELLSSFDVERIDPVTLLFQTGYLTIQASRTRHGRVIYELGFPNLEVRIAFHETLIDSYTELTSQKIGIADGLLEQLESGNLNGLYQQIRRLFAAIPYRNFTAKTLPDFEGYYASVLYAFFASLGLEIIPEDITNHGQVDLTVKAAGHVYVMEIKLLDADKVEDNPALAQIRARGYADKYRGLPGQRVYRVGLVFSRGTRNLIAFDWDEDPGP